MQTLRTNHASEDQEAQAGLGQAEVEAGIEAAEVYANSQAPESKGQQLVEPTLEELEQAARLAARTGLQEVVADPTAVVEQAPRLAHAEVAAGLGVRLGLLREALLRSTESSN